MPDERMKPSQHSTPNYEAHLDYARRASKWTDGEINAANGPMSTMMWAVRELAKAFVAQSETASTAEECFHTSVDDRAVIEAAQRSTSSAELRTSDPDRADFLREAQEQLRKVLEAGDIEAVRWMAQTAIDYHDSQAAGADAIGEPDFSGCVKYHEDRATQLKALLNSTPSSATAPTLSPNQPCPTCKQKVRW